MRTPFSSLALGAGFLLAGLQTNWAQSLPATPQILEKGKQAYGELCARCHGATGQGDGPAAQTLHPKPRNLVQAQYHLVSTWELVPTDEDLFAVISRGIPGTAMRPQPSLSEETVWALVHYTKSLAGHPLEYSSPTPPPATGGPGTGVIQVPPEPPYDEAARHRAAELFAQGCAGCHGATGKGDGQTQQIGSNGNPTRPRDMSLGVFKGGREPEAVYRRIVVGMPGTPMPMSEWALGDDAWSLVHYVLAMSSPLELR